MIIRQIYQFSEVMNRPSLKERKFDPCAFFSHGGTIILSIFNYFLFKMIYLRKHRSPLARCHKKTRMRHTTDRRTAWTKTSRPRCASLRYQSGTRDPRFNHQDSVEFLSFFLRNLDPI